ncbi:MAG TPA: IS1 family transposase, partial [Anaerolineae bacterium]
GRKWQPRTPAMAAGLTDHVWTLEELLSYRIPPSID